MEYLGLIHYFRNCNNSSFDIPACSNIDSNVPNVTFGICFLWGMITSCVLFPAFLNNAVWLPFPLFGAYSKPTFRKIFQRRKQSYFESGRLFVRQEYIQNMKHQNNTDIYIYLYINVLWSSKLNKKYWHYVCDLYCWIR